MTDASDYGYEAVVSARPDGNWNVAVYRWRGESTEQPPITVAADLDLWEHDIKKIARSTRSAARKAQRMIKLVNYRKMMKNRTGWSYK